MCEGDENAQSGAQCANTSVVAVQRIAGLGFRVQLERWKGLASRSTAGVYDACMVIADMSSDIRL